MIRHSKAKSSKMRDLWWRHEEFDRLAAQAAGNGRAHCAARLRAARDEIAQRMLGEAPSDAADVAALVLASLPRTELDAEIEALRVRARQILGGTDEPMEMQR